MKTAIVDPKFRVYIILIYIYRSLVPFPFDARIWRFLELLQESPQRTMRFARQEEGCTSCWRTFSKTGLKTFLASTYKGAEKEKKEQLRGLVTPILRVSLVHSVMDISREMRS